MSINRATQAHAVHPVKTSHSFIEFGFGIETSPRTDFA